MATARAERIIEALLPARPRCCPAMRGRATIVEVSEATEPEQLDELLLELSQQARVALCLAVHPPLGGTGGSPDSEEEGHEVLPGGVLGLLSMEGSCCGPEAGGSALKAGQRGGAAPPERHALSVPDPFKVLDALSTSPSRLASVSLSGHPVLCGQGGSPRRLIGLALSWSHTSCLYCHLTPGGASVAASRGLQRAAGDDRQQRYLERVWTAVGAVLASPSIAKSCFAARQQVAELLQQAPASTWGEASDGRLMDQHGVTTWRRPDGSGGRARGDSPVEPQQSPVGPSSSLPQPVLPDACKPPMRKRCHSTPSAQARQKPCPGGLPGVLHPPPGGLSVLRRSSPLDDPQAMFWLVSGLEPARLGVRKVLQAVLPDYGVRVPVLEAQAATRACRTALASFSLAAPLRDMLLAEGLLQLYERLEAPLALTLAACGAAAAGAGCGGTLAPGRGGGGGAAGMEVGWSDRSTGVDRLTGVDWILRSPGQASRCPEPAPIPIPPPTAQPGLQLRACEAGRLQAWLSSRLQELGRCVDAVWGGHVDLSSEQQLQSLYRPAGLVPAPANAAAATAPHPALAPGLGAPLGTLELHPGLAGWAAGRARMLASLLSERAHLACLHSSLTGLVAAAAGRVAAAGESGLPIGEQEQQEQAWGARCCVPLTPSLKHGTTDETAKSKNSPAHQAPQDLPEGVLDLATLPVVAGSVGELATLGSHGGCTLPSAGSVVCLCNLHQSPTLEQILNRDEQERQQRPPHQQQHLPAHQYVFRYDQLSHQKPDQQHGLFGQPKSDSGTGPLDWGSCARRDVVVIVPLAGQQEQQEALMHGILVSISRSRAAVSAADPVIGPAGVPPQAHPLAPGVQAAAAAVVAARPSAPAEGFAAVHRGPATAAVAVWDELAGRRLVLPSVPCSCVWLLEDVLRPGRVEHALQADAFHTLARVAVRLPPLRLLLTVDAVAASRTADKAGAATPGLPPAGASKGLLTPVASAVEAAGNRPRRGGGGGGTSGPGGHGAGQRFGVYEVGASACVSPASARVTRSRTAMLLSSSAGGCRPEAAKTRSRTADLALAGGGGAHEEAATRQGAAAGRMRKPAARSSSREHPAFRQGDGTGYTEQKISALQTSQSAPKGQRFPDDPVEGSSIREQPGAWQEAASVSTHLVAGSSIREQPQLVAGSSIREQPQLVAGSSFREQPGARDSLRPEELQASGREPPRAVLEDTARYAPGLPTLSAGAAPQPPLHGPFFLTLRLPLLHLSCLAAHTGDPGLLEALQADEPWACIARRWLSAPSTGVPKRLQSALCGPAGVGLFREPLEGSGLLRRPGHVDLAVAANVIVEGIASGAGPKQLSMRLMAAAGATAAASAPSSGGLSFSRDEASSLLAGFLGAFPCVTASMVQLVQAVMQGRHVTSLSGRKLRVAPVEPRKATPSVQARLGREVLSAQIRTSAAEIMRAAVVAVAVPALSDGLVDRRDTDKSVREAEAGAGAGVGVRVQVGAATTSRAAKKRRRVDQGPEDKTVAGRQDHLDARLLYCWGHMACFALCPRCTCVQPFQGCQGTRVGASLECCQGASVGAGLEGCQGADTEEPGEADCSRRAVGGLSSVLLAGIKGLLGLDGPEGGRLLLRACLHWGDSTDLVVCSGFLEVREMQGSERHGGGGQGAEDEG